MSDIPEVPKAENQERDRAALKISMEMIEAGALALAEHDMQLETLEEGAERIYLAMTRCVTPGRQ